jgi:transcriptional regulator with GAF, ATPase, and Fis domain
LKQYDLKDSSASKLPYFKEIIYSPDSPLNDVLGLIMTVSRDDIPVLIMGETGTGKELIARTIHQTSRRKAFPFIAVNCGALSETLLESELFGHERGSFTGAVSRRKGRFELASGGTIFLDEISETSFAFQAKLLRVLQEGTFERIGGEQTMNVDVRVIAATNKDLNTEQSENRFRSDLFYRLNGFPVTLPPLRERQPDIPLLCKHFLQKYEFEAVSGFSDRAMDLMKRYKWPGNVRELENVVRRAAILAQGNKREQIREADLPKEMTAARQEQKLENIHIPLEDQILTSLRNLKFSRSSIKQTAVTLGNSDPG